MSERTRARAVAAAALAVLRGSAAVPTEWRGSPYWRDGRTEAGVRSAVAILRESHAHACHVIAGAIPHGEPIRRARAMLAVMLRAFLRHSKGED